MLYNCVEDNRERATVLKKRSSSQFTVSIVVPCHNEQSNVDILFDEIKKHLGKVPYEIIFIDDGSSDKTLEKLRKLAEGYPQVRYVSFSRNFGHQAALRAGLRFSKGDAVISMDADLQHPPSMLTLLIDKWQAGYDVVYTVREAANDIGMFKRLTSYLFYIAMNRLSGLHLDQGAADFRLLDREVVNVINNQNETDLFLRGYINWLGFQQIGIPYTQAKRHAGKSSYTFRRMFTLATHGMTQFSVKPLRISIVVGLLFAMFGAIYGIYALVTHFVSNKVAAGWTSLTVVILVTSGIQLILLGVVGEYVGKTFMQTKSRPEYLVRDTNIEQMNINIGR